MSLMNLIPWEPFMRSNALRDLEDWFPSVDIAENRKSYVIKVELPEVRKKDCTVTVNDGVLTIQGERKQRTEDKDEKFHHIERSYGTFLRRFTLPEDADLAKILAKYDNGMLYITVGKIAGAKPDVTRVEIS